MRLSLMVKSRGMELNKLHSLDSSLGTIDHRLPITSCYHGIGSGLVYGTTTTRTHHRHLTKVSVYLLRIGIQHIGTITIYIRRTASDTCPKMMLRDNLNGEMILLYLYVGIILYRFHHPSLNLGTRIVGMMQDTELRMATLSMQVKLTILLSVEVHAPIHHFLDLRGSVPHYLFHRLAVTDIVTGNHRILNMFLEIVHFQVGNGRHTSLRERSIGLVERSLTNDANLTFVRSSNLQGVTHTGHSSADNQEIILINHCFVVKNNANVAIYPQNTGLKVYFLYFCGQIHVNES